MVIVYSLVTNHYHTVRQLYLFYGPNHCDAYSTTNKYWATARSFLAPLWTHHLSSPLLHESFGLRNCLSNTWYYGQSRETFINHDCIKKKNSVTRGLFLIARTRSRVGEVKKEEGVNSSCASAHLTPYSASLHPRFRSWHRRLLIGWQSRRRRVRAAGRTRRGVNSSWWIAATRSARGDSTWTASAIQATSIGLPLVASATVSASAS